VGVGVEVDGPLGLPGCAVEVVARVEDEGQVARGVAVPGSELQRLPQGPFREVEVGHVSAFARLLDVGVAQAVIRGGIVGLARHLALDEADALIHARALRQERSWPESGKDESREDRHA